MLRLLLPFVAGIILYDQSLLNMTWPQLISFLAVGLTALSISFWYASKQGIAAAAFNVVGASLLLLLGWSLSAIQEYGIEPSHRQQIEQQNAESSMVVITDGPIIKAKTIRYTVQLLSHHQEKKHWAAEGKALLYVYKEEHPSTWQKGDTLLLPAQWQLISNRGNPFEMNYQKFCARKQIFWQQFILAKAAICVGIKKDKNILERIHQYCIHSLEQYIPEAKTQALLKAMILGDEREIDPNWREAYSETGIIHIVSISGAHVAILFFAIDKLFSIGPLRRFKIAKLLFGFGFIWFYVVLAGASTPALRAAVMFSMLQIGLSFEQGKNPLNLVLAAAFFLLLIRPFWLFEIGFQLSFVAVLSLLIFQKPIAGAIPAKHWSTQWLVQAVAASIAAEILIAPLVAYYFHSFPITFILSNILASLSMSIILVGGMLLLLFSAFGPLSKLLATGITWLSQGFHNAIEVLQSWGHEMFRTLYLDSIVLVVIYVCIIGIGLYLLQRRKVGLWLGLSALLCWSVLHWQRSYELLAQERLVVYAQNKWPPIEVIRGLAYYSNIPGNASADYVRKNAHIAWGCQADTMQQEQNIWVLGKKHILIADSNTHIQTAFPIDILVVHSVGRYKNITQWLQHFSPSTVVVAQSEKSKLWQEWQQQCQKANIQLHNCATQGAFIYKP